MKTVFSLLILFISLWLVPARAEDEAPPPPFWQLYYDSSDLHNCCRALLACEGLPGLEEYAALLRRHGEERAAACRERRKVCHYPEGVERIREETDKQLAESEAALRGETRWSGTDWERPFIIARALEHLPCDAAGEPCFNVPKAQQRLQEARQTLFHALGRMEAGAYRGASYLPPQQRLRELLPLYAAYRREMQCWAVRTLSAERLLRWQQEDLNALAPATLLDREADAWLDYLRADSEEAAAQYDTCRRRACRYIAAYISTEWDDIPGAGLPTDPAWMAGEAMGQGEISETAAFFYRLRDAHAFWRLACPLACTTMPAGARSIQPLHERALAMLALAGEQQAIDQLRVRVLPQAKDKSPYLNGPTPYFIAGERIGEEFWVISGRSPMELIKPLQSAAEGPLRVEAEAERMRQALDAADKLLPTLPTKPDAACRHQLVQLAAQWYAYTYALRRWGNEDSQRSFWWYGGCVGFLPREIWADAYYLPGIRLCYRENDKLIYVDQSNAHTLLRALIDEMREQLEASLHEHRHPKPQPSILLSPLSEQIRSIRDACLHQTPPDFGELPPAESSGWTPELPLPGGLHTCPKV